MRTITNTAFSRSSYSTAPAASSAPFCVPLDRVFLRRLLRAIRSQWPRTEILLRADNHYCTPETIDFCRANGLDFIFGVAPTSTGLVGSANSMTCNPP